MKKNQILAVACCAAALLMASTAALSQESPYPSRPIRIVMPFAPGGGGVMVLRSIADKLGERMGTTIVIDNRPGASGFIGAQQVVASPPDGHTLLMGFDGSLVIASNIIKPPFDPMADLLPVAKLADTPLIVVTHPSVKARTIPQLVAYSKTLPGGISYGSAGKGTTQNMVGELLALQSGMRLTHVAYKGGGQAITDVVSGQVPMVVTVVSTAQAFVRDGRLNAVAVSSRERSPMLPDVPTVAEAGVPDFDVMAWYGIFAPSKTPKPIMDRLQKDLAAVLADPEVRERYAKAGFVTATPNKPDDFARQVQGDYKRWAKVVKDANIQAD